MVIIQSLPLHHSKVGHRITMAEGLPCAQQTPFLSLATQEDGIPNILCSLVGITRFPVPSFLLPLHSLLFLPGHRHGLQNEIKRWGKSGSQFEIRASHSSLPYNLSPLWCLLTPLLLFSQSLWSLLDYELAESRETIDQQMIAEWINTSHFLGSPRACRAEEWWRPSWTWGGSQILHGPSFPAAAYIGFLWLPWQITINPVT